MSETKLPIRSTDDDETIEENIKEARLNNEYERTLVVEAPEGDPPIRSTEVPRDDGHRERDVTPVGYSSPERRAEEEREALLGPYVGPIDGEGTDDEEQEEARLSSFTGGREDKDGNLLHDPGILPGDRYRADRPPGPRDDDGNLIADHDGDGKAAAHEGPLREAGAGGPDEDASEEEQHGSRSLDDAERDLDVEREENLPPEHDPNASEEEQKGGRGQDERDLGDAEAAGQLPDHSEFLDDAQVSDEAASIAEESKPIGAEAIEEGVIPKVEAQDIFEPNPTQPTGETATEASPGPGNRSVPAEDATAEEWRQYARDNGVTVADNANKASAKAALREAGFIQ